MMLKKKKSRLPVFSDEKEQCLLVGGGGRGGLFLSLGFVMAERKQPLPGANIRQRKEYGFSFGLLEKHALRQARSPETG